MFGRVRASWFATVVLLSWPPMFVSALWARSAAAVFVLNVTAMLGAALATWLHTRARGESLATAGWRLPSARWLAAIFAGCVAVWWLPLAIELAVGHRAIADLDLQGGALLALGGVAYLGLAPIAGFGEELAWRGYLLPRLLPLGSRKAIAIVGVVWGLWHGPLVVGAVARHAEGGALHGLARGLGTLALTTLLTIPLSAVFAWVWRRAGGVLAVAVLHGEYDATRDVVMRLVKGELGVIGAIPLLAVIVAGVIVLIRGLPEPAAPKST